MARVQRDVLRQLAGDRRAPNQLSAVVLDTTYGFQDNADALTTELVDFYRRRLGVATDVASLRRADGDALEVEMALARLRTADLIFSGPGSPSYALRQWRATALPQLLRDKLLAGGAIVFASAAALTLGRLTLPVYEIYKVGEEPHWLAGLDTLSQLGIAAAVVPHYDNGEGTGHDTRYCFVGERRLRLLEEQLPADVFILGLDEHTALVLDVTRDRARVEGRGGVTLRRAGRSIVHPAGTELPLAELRNTEAALPTGATAAADSAAHGETPAGDLEPLVRELLRAEDPQQIRASVVALAERLEHAEGERERLLEPLIALLIEVRRGARSGGDYAQADAIRDGLARLGIRLADEPDGSTDFELRP